MIRKAEEKDIKRIVELGVSFFEEAKTSSTPVFSEDKATATITSMVDADNCILLIAEDDGYIVGIMGIIICEHWFSNEVIAQELFWYVLPEFRYGHGSDLLDIAEVKAKSLGASIISMVDLGESSPVSLFLKRRGYSIEEKTHIRRI